MYPDLDIALSRAERFDTAVDGRRIVWRRWGSGPSLVLLHGGHGAWNHWVRNVIPLSQTHAVWAPDMPGYGESDELIEEARRTVDDALQACLDKGITDWGKLKTTTKDVLSDYVWKKTKRRPMILPIIMEV